MAHFDRPAFQPFWMFSAKSVSTKYTVLKSTWQYELSLYHFNKSTEKYSLKKQNKNELIVNFQSEAWNGIILISLNKQNIQSILVHYVNPKCETEVQLRVTFRKSYYLSKRTKLGKNFKKVPLFSYQKFWMVKLLQCHRQINLVIMMIEIKY